MAAYRGWLAEGACSNRAHPLQERSGTGNARCAKDLLWRALLHNPSALEVADAIGDIGGERPQHGGRMARATGGRAKGKTNVNIIISTGRPGVDGAAGQSGVPGGMGGPGAAPAVMPRQAPVMPAAAAPMPMPPMGGGMGEHGRGHGGPGMGGDRGEKRQEMLTAAADAIGITADELKTAIEGGQTIAQVAEANGKSVQSVIDALVAQATTDLTQRITDMVNGVKPAAPADAAGATAGA